MAGFFFAYSLSVVPALETLSASEYVTVLQLLCSTLLMRSRPVILQRVQ
ncbi:hypothetical protein SAMN05192552_102810 [Natrinema hispanicum]|uniref:Uncharacterized protein n=1 Tax=Natrinema hispanicum TaxID=392421 RepID=A0A1G6VHB6_9EURY|nr:hypothetical protein SAMN05192552_102810 [Natrinema hispanicum]